MVERSWDWLRQAKRDLQKAALDLEHSYYEWASFTAQQASEKAVKGLYQGLNRYVRGHSIFKMLQGLEDVLEVPEEVLHQARVLDRYYMEAQYPNGFPDGSPQDYFDRRIGEEACHAADEIVGFCADHLRRLRGADEGPS